MNFQGVAGLPGTSNLDIGGVREMLQSMGLNVPSKADQLMTDIEHQQKQVFCIVLRSWKLFLIGRKKHA